MNPLAMAGALAAGLSLGLAGAGGIILILPILVYLAGFMEVGGGFLLVPPLVKFARLPIKTASGTSLAVISLKSAAGFSRMRLTAPRLGHLLDCSQPLQSRVPFQAINWQGICQC